VAVERAMPVADLDARVAAADRSSPAARQVAAASSASRVRVSLPVASRGSASTRTTRRGTNAASTRSRRRATICASRDLRRDDEGDRGERRRAARRRRAASRTRRRRRLDRVEVEVEVADRAALAGDVDQVVRAAEEAEGLAVDDLENVGEDGRLRHVAAADGGRGAVAVEAHGVEGAPLGAAVVRRVATWPASVQP
jgi:hypothetical protein